MRDGSISPSFFKKHIMMQFIFLMVKKKMHKEKKMSHSITLAEKIRMSIKIETFRPELSVSNIVTNLSIIHCN